MPDQDILDMQYELARDRSIPFNDDMPSKALLYFYAKYKKEREEQAARQAALRGSSKSTFIPAW